jgi:spore coat polysaccharide biosynthesis protein SpsF
MSDVIPILIAVRLKSKRLEKKALLNLYDEPLIIKLVNRVKQSKKSNKIIVCTSTHDEDSELCELLDRHEVSYFRGDEQDVMSRFINVAENLKAETIVRVTGDNPLTDPEIMDKMIESHIEFKSEYTFNDELPHGTRSEIIQTSLLKKCHSLLLDKDNTEYMTWVLNRPDLFKVNEYKIKNNDIKRNDISLTVDIKKDLLLIREIYNFYEGEPPALGEILKLYDQLPDEYKRNSEDIKYEINKDEISLKFKTKQ